MPILALMLNATIWGLSWWPFRQFEGAGMHPLWTTVILYVLSLGVVLASQPFHRGHGIRGDCVILHVFQTPSNS